MDPIPTGQGKYEGLTQKQVLCVCVWMHGVKGEGKV